MSYRSRRRLEDTCDVCKEPAVQALHSTSGAQLDLCFNCLEKLEGGETLTDTWGFTWKIEDDILRSRHKKESK